MIASVISRDCNVHWSSSGCRDAYLLAALSYQIGPAKLLGNDKYPKSTLLTRLDRGDRDILLLYLIYCKWKGKNVSSIRKRRWVEYQLLFACQLY